MFYYALLDDCSVCITILQSSEKRDDFDCEYLEIDSNDTSLLKARLVNGQWEFPPSDDCFWGPVKNMWICPSEIVEEEQPNP